MIKAGVIANRAPKAIEMKKTIIQTSIETSKSINVNDVPRPLQKAIKNDERKNEIAIELSGSKKFKL